MIRIDPQLAKRLDDEGISPQAVQEALEAGRAANAGFFDVARDCFVTSAPVGNVTLWVSYRADADEIEILDAYYHRMQVS